MRSTLIYTILTLLTIGSVKSEFQVSDAIFDGIVHAAVTDVLEEPIENALRPSVVPYYICADVPNSITKILANESKCYTNILDYTVTIPPSPVAIFMSWVIIILFLILFVGWCFTSTIDEKMEMIGYIFCHIIGQIIYDILCGDDDD